MSVQGPSKRRHETPGPVRRWIVDVADTVARWARWGLSYPEGTGTNRPTKRISNTVTEMTTDAWPDSFYWWIDAVGSFVVFTKPRIQIGQAGNRGNDIGILGDLGSHHADLLCGPTGVLLVPRAATEVNGKSGDSFLLRDGDKIRMRGVELVYRRPQSWSMTSRLDVTSGHRLPMSMDGIVMLGETALVGPRGDAVVQTPWESALYFNWYQGKYWVRGPVDLVVDGQKTDGYAPLTPNSRMEGDWGTFRWEPIQRVTG